MPKPPRDKTLALAMTTLALASVGFLYRQNVAGQIGGPISTPKLLWLHYALLGWFILPYFFWRSSRVAPGLRRVYGAHLLSFALRGLAELWMLYVTFNWSPPYGIAHDLFDIGLITLLLRRGAPARFPEAEPANQAARHFLGSIRLALLAEMTFAWLFYQATGGQFGLYFASSTARFGFINALTLAVVLAVYPDLLFVLWKARQALFPPVGIPLPEQVEHA